MKFIYEGINGKLQMVFITCSWSVYRKVYMENSKWSSELAHEVYEFEKVKVEAYATAACALSYHLSLISSLACGG